MEDEWQREIESDTDLDLLFITFSRQQTSVDKLLEEIQQHGFSAEVEDES